MYFIKCKVDRMDDAKEFRETQYALTLLGVGSKEHGYKLICSITPKIY